ncbi:unnamed protein product [Gadus morhua 'NCC']
MSAPVADLQAPAGLQAVHRSELVYLSSTYSCGDLVATATALIMLRGWVRGEGKVPRNTGQAWQGKMSWACNTEPLVKVRERLSVTGEC